MNHSHSFSRDADSTYWDEKDDVMIVERNCNGFVSKPATPGSTMSGGIAMGGRGSEEPCNAIQKVSYEMRSIVDYHNNHGNDFSSVVLNGGDASTDGSIHLSELDSVPEWVNKVQKLIRGKVNDVDANMLLSDLSGPETVLMIATSETEYNVVFSKVDESIEE